MKKCFILLILGLTTPLYGQVSIFISDEMGGTFTLGVDGYIQNTEPVNKLIIDKLDTSSHEIYLQVFKKDTIHIKRRLKLPESGKYRYVITENFEGTTQMRFRGKASSFPTGIISMDVQSVLAWPSEDLATKAQHQKQADTLLVAVNQKQETKELAATNEVFITGKDTAKAVEIAPLVEEASPSPQMTFASMLEELKATEYEFNRLNLAKEYIEKEKLTVAEAVDILEEFRYDNTRLQFILHAHEKISDPENTKELEKTLEYELSKQQFKKQYL